MTRQDAMQLLARKGTAQNRKVYARHGVGKAMFGVSFADLKALAKQIKADHGLAVALWESGNHDARVLATMVADPRQFTARQLDQWARSLDNYIIADAFSGMVAKTDCLQAKADKWADAKKDHLGQTGWNLVSHLAMFHPDCPDEYLADKLATIAHTIHDRPNRTRHAMNMALCGIGIGRQSLRGQALEVAGRIGKVNVDHGETNCQTPDATAYLKKAAAREPAGQTTTKRTAKKV